MTSFVSAATFFAQILILLYFIGFCRLCKFTMKGYIRLLNQCLHIVQIQYQKAFSQLFLIYGRHNRLTVLATYRITDHFERITYFLVCDFHVPVSERNVRNNENIVIATEVSFADNKNL